MTDVSSFTKNFSRLEEIVERFEKDEVDLEEGVELYKEAAALMKKLKKRLKVIGNEIEEVRRTINDEDEGE
jgi:exodeoxyribonuclease VII small subunit